jgi:hypothetical protein
MAWYSVHILLKVKRGSKSHLSCAPCLSVWPVWPVCLEWGAWRDVINHTPKACHIWRALKLHHEWGNGHYLVFSFLRYAICHLVCAPQTPPLYLSVSLALIHQSVAQSFHVSRGIPLTHGLRGMPQYPGEMRRRQTNESYVDPQKNVTNKAATSSVGGPAPHTPTCTAPVPKVLCHLRLNIYLKSLLNYVPRDFNIYT